MKKVDSAQVRVDRLIKVNRILVAIAFATAICYLIASFLYISVSFLLNKC